MLLWTCGVPIPVRWDSRDKTYCLAPRENCFLTRSDLRYPGISWCSWLCSRMHLSLLFGGSKVVPVTPKNIGTSNGCDVVLDYPPLIQRSSLVFQLLQIALSIIFEGEVRRNVPVQSRSSYLLPKWVLPSSWVVGWIAQGQLQCSCVRTVRLC